MPASWHDHHAINRDICDDERELYHQIVADRKPYFMRYIYPALMAQYNTYIKNSNKNAIREFGVSVEELASMPAEQRSDRMNEFLAFYYRSLPVGEGNCVMNRICRRFEAEFDGFLVKNKPSEKFDYVIMKSGRPYTRSQITRLSELYKSYNNHIREFKTYATVERVDDDEMFRRFSELRDDFLYQCSLVCSDRFALCDMLLDICYRKNSMKGFVWEICGKEIIENLLRRNSNEIFFPARDDGGDITYHGEQFSMHKAKLECFDEYHTE